MKASELDQELSELDDRVDRVRALYEQYFLGLEKLEPQVPRKEIDRRIWALRREQIRNTAQRFRFNTIVQRYNSLSQYWGRVTREIENGTYRRDVMKAAARFGAEEVMTAVGKKRMERFKKLIDRQQKDAAAAAPERRRKKPVYEVEESDARWTEDDYDAPTPPPQDALAHALVGASAGPPPPPPPEERVSAPPPSVSSYAPADPGAAAKKAAAGLRWGTGPARPSDPEAARRRLAEMAAKVGVESGDVAPVPAAPAPSPAAPPPKRKPLMSAPLDVSPGSEPPPPEPPRAVQRPAAPAARDVKPARKPPASNRPRKDLDDLRLREIYNQYVETKRKTNESTAGITYEKLADSLKVQAEKLRAQHAVKTVDYEVVVKNGKALLKPILK